MDVLEKFKKDVTAMKKDIFHLQNYDNDKDKLAESFEKFCACQTVFEMQRFLIFNKQIAWQCFRNEIKCDEILNEDVCMYAIEGNTTAYGYMPFAKRTFQVHMYHEMRKVMDRIRGKYITTKPK
jgi:hypothetical protein